MPAHAKPARSKTCQCGVAIIVKKNGPAPKTCRDCKVLRERDRGRSRKRYKGHTFSCKQCGEEFKTNRLRQKYCSEECGHLANRKRSMVACRACQKHFEHVASAAAARRYCSRACFLSVHERALRVCNGCGVRFKAANYKSEWQGRGKFCTRDCYMDARWGKNRPKKESSQNDKGRASRGALATSLRKRCKHFGVVFDPACTREAVCAADGWVCQSCGVKCHKGAWRFNKKTRKASRRSAEHDHIVPLSWGVYEKGNTFDNSQCLCRRCNARKSSKGGGQLRLVFGNEA
jgi:5-methylcytosine-specific restriction endonuclease McrA